MYKNKLTLAVSMTALLASTPIVRADAMADLEAAAKAEGMLTTIALPHSWCGYGDVIAGFKAKYPEITVNELNPDAGSADELEAVRANIGNTGPQAPDVIDVGRGCHAFLRSSSSASESRTSSVPLMAAPHGLSGTSG